MKLRPDLHQTRDEALLHNLLADTGVEREVEKTLQGIHSQRLVITREKFGELRDNIDTSESVFIFLKDGQFLQKIQTETEEIDGGPVKNAIKGLVGEQGRKKCAHVNRWYCWAGQECLEYLIAEFQVHAVSQPGSGLS